MCRLALTLQSLGMGTSSTTDLIADRVERLLLRHEELQRTNGLLQEQIRGLLHERDGLQTRLLAASKRLDLLLSQWPDSPTPPSNDGTSSGDSLA